MRVLVFTQKMDKNDAVLGFFHGWVEEFAKRNDLVEVVCLYKGEYDLPKNVTVYSLGKEKGVSKLGYVWNLYKYLYLIRGSYDRVFVHMNQEYVLLCGFYWKIKNIPVYMWRNHPKGSFITRIAVRLSRKVFCTSSSAFVSRYKKTVLMPVGNDTDMFSPVLGVVKKKHSVCMLGRIAPIKHVDLALEAIKHMVSRGNQVSLGIIGSASEKDMEYYNSLVKYISDNNLSSYINIQPEVPFNKHPEIFSSYEINLNLTDSGSFDKTILGGTSCGAIPLVSNDSLRGILPDVCITTHDPKEIAVSLEKLLIPAEQVKISNDLERFVDSQSRNALMDKLSLEMK